MSSNRIKDLLSLGSQIAGAAAGGAVGFFAAGPAGAAGAGALGVAAATLLQDISTRALSHREAVRVGATAAYALDYIRQRLETGEQPRNDGFFDTTKTNTSAAEEIFEGVLLTSKNDHEEQKARYYGRLFGNVSFDPHCSQQEANYLLHVMDNMTFLQLILLNIFADTTRFHLRSIRYEPGEHVSYDLLTILSATLALFQAGLLRLREPGQDSYEVVFDMNELRPAHVSLGPQATRLVQIAGLADIADENLTPIVSSLSTPPIAKA